METCPNCGRKFFPGRLALHLKSCKKEKPMKIMKKKLNLQNFHKFENEMNKKVDEEILDTINESPLVINDEFEVLHKRCKTLN